MQNDGYFDELFVRELIVPPPSPVTSSNEFAYFFSMPIGSPLVNTSVPLNNYLPSDSIVTNMGSLILSPNNKYFIETNIERVTLANHLGVVKVQWLNDVTNTPVGDVIQFNGIGASAPVYGPWSFDFFIHTSNNTSLRLSLWIVFIQNIQSLDRVTVKVRTLS